MQKLNNILLPILIFILLQSFSIAAEPTNLPKWDENNTNVIPISTELQDDGFALKNKPASGTFNSWFRNVYKWTEWFQEKFGLVDAEIAKLAPVDSIAELRTIRYTPTDGQAVTVLGTSVEGDGGGDIFFWDEASVDADDSKDVIKVSAIATGRWLRLYKNTLNIGQITTEGGKKYQVLAGVIYYNTLSLDWRFLDNVDHAPIGFTGISTLVTGEVQVEHDFGGTKAITLLVSSDETFAQLGIVAGASVGIDFSNITISAPIEFNIDTVTGTVVAPSYWGTEITAAATPATGVCDITHPPTQTGGVPTMSPISSAGTIAFGNSPVQAGYSTTTVEMRGASQLTGRFAYSGSAWVYSGSLYNTPTTSWSAGVLTVTHDATDLHSLSITEEGASYRASGAAGSTTSFDVRFYDSDGVLITTEDTSMDFYFNRTGNVRSNNIAGEFAVRRGCAPVDANNAFPTAGNFWLIGLIEYE